MRRWISGLLMLALAAGMTAPAAMARANEKRAHALAIGSSAVAGYLLLHRNTRTAGLAAAGLSAYAWKKEKDAVKQRHHIQQRRTVKHTRKYKGGYYSRDGKWRSTHKAARR